MILPYAPDDDESADEYVNDALRTHDMQAWRALTGPRYAVQTERVLRATLDNIAVMVAQRTAEIDRLRERRARREITHEQFEQDKSAWKDWQARTGRFEVLVRRYLRMAADAARPLRGDSVREELAAMLQAVVGAVHRHRGATLLDGLEPTPADRALWARLTTLSVRLNDVDPPVTLDELARTQEGGQQSVTPTRLPRGEGAAAAAALLLTLAGADDVVPRPTLVAEWAKHSTHLAGPSEGAAKGKGSRAARALGRIIRMWERDGIVCREAVDGVQVLRIVDPEGMRRLARAE